MLYNTDRQEEERPKMGLVSPVKGQTGVTVPQFLLKLADSHEVHLPNSFRPHKCCYCKEMAKKTNQTNTKKWAVISQHRFNMSANVFNLV